MLNRQQSAMLFPSAQKSPPEQRVVELTSKSGFQHFLCCRAQCNEVFFTKLLKSSNKFEFPTKKFSLIFSGICSWQSQKNHPCCADFLLIYRLWKNLHKRFPSESFLSRYQCCVESNSFLTPIPVLWPILHFFLESKPKSTSKESILDSKFLSFEA